MPVTHTSEIRDGMRVEWDVPIEMDDGLLLRADVFRPTDDGTYPVIMTHGPYGKGLAYQDGYPTVWKQHPEAIAGSSNLYQTGRRWTPRSGSRMATYVSASTLVAAVIRPDI